MQITITQLIEVLTGFKYIGQQILGLRQAKKASTYSDLKKAMDV